MLQIQLIYDCFPSGNGEIWWNTLQFFQPFLHANSPGCLGCFHSKKWDAPTETTLKNVPKFSTTLYSCQGVSTYHKIYKNCLMIPPQIPYWHMIHFLDAKIHQVSAFHLPPGAVWRNCSRWFASGTVISALEPPPESFRPQCPAAWISSKAKRRKLGRARKRSWEAGRIWRFWEILWEIWSGNVWNILGLSSWNGINTWLSMDWWYHWNWTVG